MLNILVIAEMVEFDGRVAEEIVAKVPGTILET